MEKSFKTQYWMDGFSTDVVLVTGNFENATLEWKLGRVTLGCNNYKSEALNHQ